MARYYELIATCSQDFTSFPLMSFFSSGVPSPKPHLVVLALLPSSGPQLFLRLPLFLTILMGLKSPDQEFCGMCFNLGLSGVFLMLDWDCGVCEEDQRGEAAYASRHSKAKCHQRDLLPMRVITGLVGCLPDFPAVKLLSLPFPHSWEGVAEPSTPP